MTISKIEQQKIEMYLNSSEEEIEASIGRILLSYESGPALASPTYSIARERFRKYFNDNLSLFRQKICTEWEWYDKVKIDDVKNNVEIIAAIMDLLASCVGIPPTTMVATLLFKRGLKELCDEAS